jgi:hypothetical protein
MALHPPTELLQRIPEDTPHWARDVLERQSESEESGNVVLGTLGVASMSALTAGGVVLTLSQHFTPGRLVLDELGGLTSGLIGVALVGTVFGVLAANDVFGSSSHGSSCASLDRAVDDLAAVVAIIVGMVVGAVLLPSVGVVVAEHLQGHPVSVGAWAAGLGGTAAWTLVQSGIYSTLLEHIRFFPLQVISAAIAPVFLLTTTVAAYSLAAPR